MCSDWLKIRNGCGTLIYSAGQGLILEVLSKIVTDKSIFYFLLLLLFIYIEKIRLGIKCEQHARQMIHLKCRALFSLKNAKKSHLL